VILRRAPRRQRATVDPAGNMKGTAMQITYACRLRGQAKIKGSGKVGEVRGLSTNVDGVNMASVRYLDDNGNMQEAWERETDLEAVDVAEPAAA
jgi:hypothetical protein